MTLFLTSNGLKGKIADVFQTLLKKGQNKNVVAFITTAAYGEEDNPTWLYKYKNELIEQGINDIRDVDLRYKTEKEVVEILQESDIVYVNGGNTFFLLYWVRKSGFDKALKKFLEDGKLYIGVSAGSIICGPTIEVARLHLSDEYPADTNTIGVIDLTGLNLVPFVVSPHYEENQKTLLEKEAQKLSLPFFTLTDKQAILVKDKKTEVIGEGEKIMFNAH